MKKLHLAASAMALLAGSASAQDGTEVKIGIILGFTGPLESITPNMAAAAEMAAEEVNAAGTFMGGGHTVTTVRADSTCIDAAAATAAAEGLVAEGISAIMGADCSGVTGAILTNVAVPNGIGMISPSATSPGLSTAEDNGLFFRTSPSDARQGVVMADILEDRGITEVALTFTNNDNARTVQVAIAQFAGRTQFDQPYANRMAASVVVTLPLIVLVLIFQRKILAGLTSGAVKG